MAMKATPPTTPPAMVPGLTRAEDEAAVFSSSAGAPTVADVVAVGVDDVELAVKEAAVFSSSAGAPTVAKFVTVSVELTIKIGFVWEGDRNGAATAGLESRKPAVRSPSGQPVEQGLDLQQPMKGGSVAAQVYHRLPEGHC